MKRQNIFFAITGFQTSFPGKQILASLLSLALLLAPQTGWAYQDQNAPPPDQGQAPPSQAAPYTQQTPEQLQELVAPIALYPDSLVAQILAASTFPEQVVEADRWLQAHPDLKGDDLAKAVDQQPWDPSVKALTAFPTVLGNMDKNLSWASSLGDAYYNQQQNVMDAIQVMRQRAQQAGNLKTTPEQTVTTQGSTVVIQPANPDVVYVPAYDPWAVYGGPLDPWPGWYPYPGIWFGGPYLSFGAGFGIGFFGGFGWGWPHWGFDWGHRAILFNHGRYVSRSRTFYNRNAYYRGGGARGVARPFNGNARAARGYAEPRGQSGVRSGAFSGIERGGDARSFSSRGRVSSGGSFGGGARGGGGFGGGGRGGGGGHR
jgi:uncharacterized membrane protein YgcG